MKCLSIESVEYCYFIPIISQLANYWGDEKTVYFCKRISQQINQHLNYATYIHFLLSGQFKDHLILDEKFQTLLKKSKLETEKQKYDDFQFLYQNIYISNKNNFSFKNQNLILTSYPFLKTPLEQEYPTTYGIFFEKEKRINNFPFKISKKEKEIILKLKRIDNSFFQLLENTKMKGKIQQFDVKLNHEHCAPLKTFGRKKKLIDKEIYFFFLQILRYRKICKAEQWYPFVSTLALNHGLFQLSHNFIHLSQYEKQMSQLVTKLINI
jgi:hypothetical protein